MLILIKSRDIEATFTISGTRGRLRVSSVPSGSSKNLGGDQ